jgi:hypothetical protein
LTSIKNAFQTEVINADEIKPVVIGEGISELSNTNLTKEKREDIATALGVPQTILFSNAANYATAKVDQAQFYTMTVSTEILTIQTAYNDQVFAPLGLKLQFVPEAMEIFQEEEVNRSAALRNLSGAGIPPWIGGQVLGFDLPSGVTWEDVEAESMRYIEMTATNPMSMAKSANGNNAAEEAFNQAISDWKKHALKAVREGKAIKTAEQFKHDGAIPSALAKAIGGALGSAETVKDVKRAFRSAESWKDYP